MGVEPPFAEFPFVIMHTAHGRSAVEGFLASHTSFAEAEPALITSNLPRRKVCASMDSMRMTRHASHVERCVWHDNKFLKAIRNISLLLEPAGDRRIGDTSRVVGTADFLGGTTLDGNTDLGATPAGGNP